MKAMAIPLILLFLQLSCSQNKSKPITQVSQNELNSGILIDVRTPEEYEAGHLNGAININWFSDDFFGQVGTLPKDKTLYLYCKKGGRSIKAAEALDSLGYKVMDLSGGYSAWQEQN